MRQFIVGAKYGWSDFLDEIVGEIEGLELSVVRVTFENEGMDSTEVSWL